MKRLTTLVLTSLLFSLVGCSSTPTVTEEYDCFFGERNEEHEHTLVNLATNPTSYQDNGYYRFDVAIDITNNLMTTVEYNLFNFDIIRENDSTHYETLATYKTIQVMGENTARVHFMAKIPSDLKTYNYCFMVTVSSIKYNFKLYERPDELRETLMVSYMVDGAVYHNEWVKKGRALGVDYVYDSRDHLSYCDIWELDGVTITSSTIINESITVVGTTKDNLYFLGDSSSSLVVLSKINHVPSDGKLVLPDRYDGQKYYIVSAVIADIFDVKEIYIPSTIIRIYSKNFTNCISLETIYYAGTEDEWNSILQTPAIASGLNVVFNTSFGK